MTLREWLDGWTYWGREFWQTVMSTPLLDWPLSYFGYLALGALLLLLAAALLAAAILNVVGTSISHRGAAAFAKREAARLQEETAHREAETRALREREAWRKADIS